MLCHPKKYPKKLLKQAKVPNPNSKLLIQKPAKGQRRWPEKTTTKMVSLKRQSKNTKVPKTKPSKKPRA